MGADRIRRDLRPHAGWLCRRQWHAGDQGDGGGAALGVQGLRLQQGLLHGRAGHAVRNPGQGAQGRPDVDRSRCREPGIEPDLFQVPEFPRRPSRGRFPDRLPAHDGGRQSQCLRDRRPDGRRNRNPPRGTACGGALRVQDGGRRAGLRYCGGGDGGGERDGFGRPAAGGARQDDRRCAGRYLPRHSAVLRFRCADRLPARTEDGRGRQDLRMHEGRTAGQHERLCPSGGDRVRPQGAVLAGPPQLQGAGRGSEEPQGQVIALVAQALTQASGN
ncbi:hypothetical protein METUNv1_02604 [Methyloversatilis universalis FAM5]|uniref:Uncharacterized protein n=1 Tax=Methyloversatilis universalis (strain ATCC BAA-1314 / DSM 25237 / JCM 13912 / CCUG 52030 / FAM5) TaxID=1000565 RepID=F5RE86_METUF|nr:hypothetical protein METUNv1_02604 [Methyloversatilis universalis FAM5]